MNKNDVIRHFSGFSGAPVDIEEHILPFLRDGGLKDELYVWEVDVDSSKLRGKLVHWEPWDYNNDWVHDYDRPRRVGDIYVSKELSVPFQRVVVCKELLHVLDPDENRVDATEEIERLVKRIVLPLGAEASLDHKTLTDVLGLYDALAVLFPWKVREALVSKYLDKTLSAQAIADYLELPVQYIHVVLSESWPEAYDLLLKD